MSIIHVIVISLLASSCSVSENSEAEFGWILVADPKEDAILSASNGDLRLIGLSGMILSEVSLMDKSCEYGSNVRYLKIDDVIDSYAERKYQAIAPVYAEMYNHHLIKYLRQEGIEVCNS
ncbi:hypothetical protein ACJJIQ_10925 [Microbulbifer sp. ANSA003]|uniref:hypothetical protein n=1 Tax=Microbulbifer sp. ANSA003 TaxID=3243360 RepID=UPI004042CB43